MNSVNRGWQIFIWVGLILLRSPGVVAAEPTQNLGAFIGYSFGGHFHGDENSPDRELAESSNFALTYDVDTYDNSQVEFYLSRQATDLKESDTPGRALFPVNVYYLHVGGLAYFETVGSFQPYVLGGIGLSRFDPDLSGADPATRLSMSLGFGMRVPVTRSLNLRFDARGLGTFFDSSGALFCVNGQCAVHVQSQIFGQGQLVAGIDVRF